MAKGKGELAVEISPARLLGVPAHILTHQLHCAVGGHSCISHVAEAQDCNATPPPSTSTSPPDTSSRCLCQTVCCQAPHDPHQQPGQRTQCTSRLPRWLAARDGWSPEQHTRLQGRELHVWQWNLLPCQHHSCSSGVVYAKGQKGAMWTRSANRRQGLSDVAL